MLRKQSAAMTASMDGIGIINERLEFTYANDSLAKLFGYPGPQAMIGRSLCDKRIMSLTPRSFRICAPIP